MGLFRFKIRITETQFIRDLVEDVIHDSKETQDVITLKHKLNQVAPTSFYRMEAIIFNAFLTSYSLTLAGVSNQTKDRFLKACTNDIERHYGLGLHMERRILIYHSGLEQPGLGPLPGIVIDSALQAITACDSDNNPELRRVLLSFVRSQQNDLVPYFKKLTIL